MKKSLLFLISTSAILLTACQSAPHQYNGSTGYRIENKTTISATLAYTLAARSNRDIDERKLQSACRQVLGNSKPTYNLDILSVNEIANPITQQEDENIQLGNSRMAVGLSDTPSLNNSEGYATRQALNTKPGTLKVVRYTCS